FKQHMVAKAPVISYLSTLPRCRSKVSLMMVKSFCCLCRLCRGLFAAKRPRTKPVTNGASVYP
ncbi:hypothetical protein Q4595_18380, partial [Wenyingzhuangia sp. 1_MG-2023]|nr:hypothetical protein [Wenyingzhuangia sp. 1_MG-2023]